MEPDSPTDVRDRPIRPGQPVGVLRLRSFFSTHWQWVFLGQIAAILGTFAVVKVAAVVSSTAEFGRFALILAVGFGISAVVFSPISGWALRYYQEAREAQGLRGYYHALLLALAVGTAVSAVLVGASILLFDRQLHRMSISPGMMGIALLLGLGVSYSDSAVSVANAAFFRRSAATFLVLSSWVRVVAVVIVYALGGHSARTLALGASIAILWIVPAQAWGLRRAEGHLGPVRSRIDRSYVGSLVTYSLPLFLWGVPGYALGFADRLLLAYYTNPATVGVYAAMAAATINLANAGSAAANRVLEPTLFAASGAATDAARVRPALRMVTVTTAFIAPLALPLVLIYLVWPKAVITLFASGSYQRGSQYLWLLLVASALYLASQQLMYKGFILKHLGPYVPLKYAHAGVLVAGLVLTIPRYGLRGMILTILAAHALQLLLVLIVNKLRVNFSAGSESIR